MSSRLRSDEIRPLGLAESSKLLVATLVALIALQLGPVAGKARADIDPPSDYLLLQRSYVPRLPQPSRTLSSQLERLCLEMKAAGYPLEVAVIASEIDLGAVPFYVDRPNDYALFLGRELDGGSGTQPLLVVTPAGVASYPSSAKSEEALGAVHVPENIDQSALADELVKTAILGALKLAAAAGHPVKLPAASASSRGGGGPPLFAFALPVAAVIAWLGVIAIRDTRAKRRGEE